MKIEGAATLTVPMTPQIIQCDEATLFTFWSGSSKHVGPLSRIPSLPVSWRPRFVSSIV
jgi:hypothetical protein